MARPSTTHARARRRGLTLVEVMVVIALLGIAAALVVPAMGTTGGLRVQGAIRTIVSDLTFAQSDAIAFQQPRAVVFDQAANSYRLVQVVHGDIDEANTLYDGSARGKQYVVNLGNNDFGNARITSVAINGTSSTLIYDDMGTPVASASGNTPGSGGRIRVEGQGSVHDIIVEPYTGRITVRRISGD